ncbi:hypothetical protein ACFVVX_15145 [Kitasatospora sp. NPDC058170]|uniref:hypothetical protein n=1 Tax=Kitasatospora sp. NPDC058170 TaxID=3346364 RepID=UPI0036D8AEFF
MSLRDGAPVTVGREPAPNKNDGRDVDPAVDVGEHVADVPRPLGRPRERSRVFTGTRHPLLILRACLGLNQTEYAELVARTHAAMGHGHLAARPEKVSRWENGYAAPERTTQLAIAQIHRVPPREVDRTRWPVWLHPAVRRTAMTAVPWNSGSMIEILRSLGPGAGKVAFTTGDGPSPVVSGPLLASFLSHALTALLTPSATAGQDRPPTPGVTAALERRVDALEGMTDFTGSKELCPVVAGELCLLATVTVGWGHGCRAASRLLLLVVRVASLGAWLHEELGQDADAEEHHLLAVRAAVAAGVPFAIGACLEGLARLHRRTGCAADARALVRAAVDVRRAACPHRAREVVD